MHSRSAIIIFKAYVLSRLEYGSVFCTGSYANPTDELQKLVNKALIKCLKLLYNSNVYDMHDRARLLPLSIRRNATLLKVMFQYSTEEHGDLLSLKGSHNYDFMTRSS